ncbi:chymotrypsin-2-like [Agrilus planipennis]|uniref:Chymotrypsin-2-like n=1 Tax=Agrilus planipennis TaxID=224129 RepID=A0A1W4WUR8_AGRPL|nr:chymotrypsin-2-like [Agrilus planipennis]
MNFFVVLLGLVCALAYGAPYVEYEDYPQAAYILYSVLSDDTRVVNGEPAVRDQIPYQLSLRWANVSGSPSHLCGGTLVTPSMVLTAAHCMLFDYGTYDVVAGLLDRTENTSSTQRRDIETRILHENWPGGNVVSRYDIALLKVTSPFVLTHSVQLIRLPCQNAIPSGSVVLSGWGYTSSLDDELPNILQYVEVDIISNEQCADDLITASGSADPLDDTMICTNGHQNISSCGGDSGSPLVQNGIQVGIVSWGIVPCGVTVGSTVYTRVSNYTDWIKSKL